MQQIYKVEDFPKMKELTFMVKKSGQTMKLGNVKGWSTEACIRELNKGSWVIVPERCYYTILEFIIGFEEDHHIVLEDWFESIIELIPDKTIVKSDKVQTFKEFKQLINGTTQKSN